MKVIAHCKDEKRVTEEEFEVIEKLPAVGDKWDRETVKVINELTVVPEFGMETLKNYKFYKLSLTIMGEFEDETSLCCVDYVAVRCKKFNRIKYVADRFDKEDCILYFNDDLCICKEELVGISHRTNALEYIKSFTKAQVDEWFECSYEEEMENQHRGGENVLAEVECGF